MLYTQKQIGWVDGIPCGQLTPHMRQIQTDNGEGTVLRMTQKDATFVLEIVQYDQKGRPDFTGYEWELNNTPLSMSIQKNHDESWRLKGTNGAVLQVDHKDGDVQLCILHESTPDLPSQVPSFSQLASGGKCLTLRTGLIKIVRQLKEDEAVIISTSLAPTYYMYIERLYEMMIK